MFKWYNYFNQWHEFGLGRQFIQPTRWFRKPVIFFTKHSSGFFLFFPHKQLLGHKWTSHAESWSWVYYFCIVCVTTQYLWRHVRNKYSYMDWYDQNKEWKNNALEGVNEGSDEGYASYQSTKLKHSLKNAEGVMEELDNEGWVTSEYVEWLIPSSTAARGTHTCTLKRFRSCA